MSVLLAFVDIWSKIKYSQRIGSRKLFFVGCHAWYVGLKTVHFDDPVNIKGSDIIIWFCRGKPQTVHGVIYVTIPQLHKSTAGKSTINLVKL